MSNNRRKVRFKQGAMRKKAGSTKLTNVEKQAKKLQTRIAREGETAWLKDAVKRVQTRAKKYGVKLAA